MKLLAALVALVAVVATVVAEEPITLDYHNQIGIPLAAKIKAREEAADFDGSRITGGNPAALGAHPHLGGLVITLTNGRTSVCGSSLVSRTRLVTAAHCWMTNNSQARQFVVVLGSVRLFSGGTRITTTNVEMHANYNTANLNNDVAIIRINSVTLNNNIQAINLPSNTNNNYVGTWAWAAGFGANGDNHPISNNQLKHEVSLQVITNQVCARTYGNSVVVSSVICVNTDNRRSTCGGDSGGPLWVWANNRRELIGITSFGHVSGCQRGHPAGFARATSFISWFQARL